ncbi:MAG TPA: hypothetical protein P5277_00725 [Candidatus Paceibacterota bacterium]|nr:hypothetical protein [Candidatus Paceibacterota bacterium]
MKQIKKRLLMAYLFIGLFLIIFMIENASAFFSRDKEIGFINTNDNFYSFSSDLSSFSIEVNNSLNTEGASIYLDTSTTTDGGYYGSLYYFNNNEKYDCEFTGYYNEGISAMFGNKKLRFNGFITCKEKNNGIILLGQISSNLKLDSNCRRNSNINYCKVISDDLPDFSSINLFLFEVNNSLQDFQQNIKLKNIETTQSSQTEQITNLTLWRNNVSFVLATNSSPIGNGSYSYNITIYNLTNINQRISSLEANQTNITARVSLLESWKEFINRALVSLDEIGFGLNKLTERVVVLENKSIVIQNGSLPNYFKYLSTSDRKTMICGYAQDNHLTQINDLGLNCNITYRQTSTREYATCKCK